MQVISNVPPCSPHTKNISVLIYGILLMATYKIWKYVVFNFFIQYQDEDTHYYLTQACYTLYRIFATVVGMFIMIKYYQNFKMKFFKDNFKITAINLFLILPIFFFAHWLSFDVSFYLARFLKEVFFNVFTGSFEEIVFRGLILVGLAQYFKPMTSIFLSSLLFSLWHYDVINDPIAYVGLFFWSFYAGLCYLRGASLASLILFHFLWDQIFFGFNWSSTIELSDNVLTLIHTVILIPFILLHLKELSTSSESKFDNLR